MILKVSPFINEFFVFNDSPTTEIYTLSLHDALPISHIRSRPTAATHAPPSQRVRRSRTIRGSGGRSSLLGEDRKSTRLNSSHVEISYAVFCLKKKKTVRMLKGSPGRHECNVTQTMRF